MGRNGMREGQIDPAQYPLAYRRHTRHAAARDRTAFILGWQGACTGLFTGKRLISF